MTVQYTSLLFTFVPYASVLFTSVLFTSVLFYVFAVYVLAAPCSFGMSLYHHHRHPSSSLIVIIVIIHHHHHHSSFIIVVRHEYTPIHATYLIYLLVPSPLSVLATVYISPSLKSAAANRTKSLLAYAWRGEVSPVSLVILCFFLPWFAGYSKIVSRWIRR